MFQNLSPWGSFTVGAVFAPCCITPGWASLWILLSFFPSHRAQLSVSSECFWMWIVRNSTKHSLSKRWFIFSRNKTSKGRAITYMDSGIWQGYQHPDSLLCHHQPSAVSSPRWVVLQVWSLAQWHQRHLEILRNANSQLHSSPGNQKLWDYGTSDLYFKKPSGWNWCTLKFENHWSLIKTVALT